MSKSSPHHHSSTQQSEGLDVGMNGLEGLIKENSSSSASSTSSLNYSSGNSLGAREGKGTEINSNMVSNDGQQFNLESFDFGADFNLPTSLDELSIFQHQQHSSSNNATKYAESRSTGGHTSSDGMASSPQNLNYSPRSAIRDSLNSVGARGGSRTQSPHPLSMSNSDLMQSNEENQTNTLSTSDLHSLLIAVQGSSMPTQHDQRPHVDHSSNSQQQQPDSTMLDHSTLSVPDLERLIREKEQSERLQVLQTALWRQQLESMQRQKQMEQYSPSTQTHQRSPLDASAAEMLQQLQHLTQQMNSTTPTPQNPHNNSFGSQQQQQQQKLSDAIRSSSSFPSSQAQQMMSTMTQYGLVTPLSSGMFTNSLQTSHPFVSPIHLPSSSQAGLMDGPRSYDPNIVNGTFTPLESPAITPASVFSSVGGSNITSQDMFSPLTSPALRPLGGNVNDDMTLPSSTSPHHGPTTLKGKVQRRGKASPYMGPQGKKTTTPSASPVTLPTKSVPRKNRSTTAEARANRARPSPLVKPTISNTTTTTTSTATSSSRKRAESVSANSLPSPLGAIASKSSTHLKKNSMSDSKTSTGFPPLSAGTGSTRPMDASPSEATASTPSPIDLNNSSQMPPSDGKPITPSSIMGILPEAQNGKAHSAKGKLKLGDGTKQVSFATQQQSANAGISSPNSLQNIQPGGIPSADRDAWMSIKPSGNGGGGGLESRRTSHKAAEQKRRDSLKFCFDELRGMLPAITLDDDAPGGSSLGPDGLPEDQEDEEFSIEEVGDAESARIANRAISKVALLRHSNEYLIRLKNRLERRNLSLDYYRKQVIQLQSRLGYPTEAHGDVMTMHVDGIHPSINNHMDIS